MKSPPARKSTAAARAKALEPSRPSSSSVGGWLLLVAAVLLQSARGAVVVLDRFAVETGPSAWQPQNGAPLPRSESGAAGGLVFECPFGRLTHDRVYWDRQTAWDLEPYTTLELDLDCDAPSALRSLAIYFQSGEGWYIWNRPLPRAGRQRVIMRRHEFAVEGSPGGWDRITRVRLSPWRGESRDATLRLYALRARSDTLAILVGGASVPEAERAIAARTADRIGRWLDAIGASYVRWDDERLREADLVRIRTVILPYNATPPPALTEALLRLLQRDGRLLVFYSADARLAAAMGFRLGEWTPAERPLRWASIRFLDTQGGFPERVFQESGNLYPVYPSAAGTSVLAVWEDGQQQPAAEPALVVGPRGAWMSHILLPDDALNKQQMLAALLLRYAPDQAADILETALRRAAQVDSFADFQAATTGIRALAAPSSAARRVEARLQEAERIHAGLLRLDAARQGGAILAETRRLRQALTEAYAWAQAAPAGEWRAVWDHQGVGWYPGDWDRSCRELKAAGINTILVNAVWAGVAHYPSEIVPGSTTLRLYGDQLAQCLEAASRHGLRVHVWYVCWNLSGAPESWVKARAAEGRLQTNSSGRTIPWLHPADARNIAYALRTIEEVARRYEIAGIHLDYIRWPENHTDYSPSSRAAFERTMGVRARRWPADVQAGGTLYSTWVEWRARVISDFVQQARQTLRRARPDARLSAAVWGNYPGCIQSVGQDWGLWLKRGWIDFVVPMNYTENLQSFVALTRRQLSLPTAEGRVFPGIGVTSGESSLSPDLVIEQIAAARRLGARGFALFHMNAELRDQVLPLLRTPP